MSQFSRFDVMLNEEGATVAGQRTQNTPDPRPDLAEDSYFWIKFLTLAARESRYLFEVLHGFRCCGTRLVKAESGKLAGLYILRPDIDPAGADAWTSQGEYEKWKAKYLKPMETELLQLLSDFNKQVKQTREVS